MQVVLIGRPRRGCASTALPVARRCGSGDCRSKAAQRRPARRRGCSSGRRERQRRAVAGRVTRRLQERAVNRMRLRQLADCRGRRRRFAGLVADQTPVIGYSPGWRVVGHVDRRCSRLRALVISHRAELRNRVVDFDGRVGRRPVRHQGRRAFEGDEGGLLPAWRRRGRAGVDVPFGDGVAVISSRPTRPGRRSRARCRPSILTSEPSGWNGADGGFGTAAAEWPEWPSRRVGPDGHAVPMSDDRHVPATKSLSTGAQHCRAFSQASIRTVPRISSVGRIDAGRDLDRRVPRDLAVVLFDVSPSPGLLVDARLRRRAGAELASRRYCGDGASSILVGSVRRAAA